VLPAGVAALPARALAAAPRARARGRVGSLVAL